GTILAGAMLDGRILLWEAHSGKKIRELAITQRVHTIAFSPDGRLLAARGHLGQVTMWDVPTGKRRRQFIVPFEPPAGPYKITLLFAPDGQSLFMQWAERFVGYGIAEFDAVTGKKLRDLVKPKGTIRVLALSSDGKRIAWGRWPELLRVL